MIDIRGGWSLYGSRSLLFSHIKKGECIKLKNRKEENKSSGEVFVVLVAAAAIYYFATSLIDSWEEFWEAVKPYLLISLLILAIPVALFLFMKFTQLLYYFKRFSKIKTVEIELSRDDTTEPFEMMKFFDAVYGMLLTHFSWIGWFTGFHHFVWEQGVESGEKYIRLSAPGPILDSICKNLQSVYQNVRFIPIERKRGMPPPQQILQLRLKRNWFYQLQTLEAYEKTISESFFATLDNIDEDVGFQVIMTPVSLRRQAKLSKKQKKFEEKHLKDRRLGFSYREELKSSMSSKGKGFFDCEIRLFSESAEARQSILGAMAEASSDNRLISENYFNYLLRLMIKKQWWSWWVERAMPAIGIGPVIKLSSYNLATILQLPTMRLRVSGLRRSSVRRVPIPSGVPRNPEQAFLEDEEGRPVGIDDNMRYQNLMITGLHGVGKSTALRQYSAPVLSDLNQSAIIVTPAREDAQEYLSYIPPEKPVYIIDLARPGEFGLNILSDDEIPTDQLAGNLLSAFRIAYGNDAVGHQSADFLQQPVYALRKAREISPEWRKAIPILDFRHIRKMLIDKDFRNLIISSLPEGSEEFDYWGVQLPQLLETKSEFNRKVAPILNKLNALLASERVRMTLCHPNPITLRQVIEEKAVLILHTAKSEVGEETAKLFSNMLMSMVFQGISSQAEVPAEDRIPVNLFLDEVHGYANEALITLLQEARKYGARTAAATLSYSSLPRDLKNIFFQLFGHKVVFRTSEVEEANMISNSFAQLYSNIISLRDEDQDRVRIGADDLIQLERYYAAARFTVEGKLMPAFIAKTRAYDDRANQEWMESHSWPNGETKIKLQEVELPTFDTETSDSKEPEIAESDKEAKKETKDITKTEAPKVQNETELEEVSWPSVGNLKPEQVKEIVLEMGMSLETAMPLLKQADEKMNRIKRIYSPSKYLIQILTEKKGNRSEQKTEDEWPEVGGMKAEKVKEIVTEMELTLEETFPVLLEVDKEIKKIRESGRRINSRPKILRDFLKEYIKKKEDEAS